MKLHYYNESEADLCVCVFGCCYGSSRDDEFDIKLAAEPQWQVYLLVQNDFL